MLELSERTRATALATMAQGPVDVLVIGGGITGAGVAHDAATRGLSVALVEREDFAAGTSGRSSRLIHGGPRYLRRGELGLVYESLRERTLLMRLAPHLIRPLPFLIPVRRLAQRALVRTGLALYDALGRSIAPHRKVDAGQVARLAPGLVRSSGGILYWDGRTDDARLVIEVVRRAVVHGALVANRAEVVSIPGQGRVRGAVVRDRLTGATLEVHARVTVNATGAWADRVQGLATPAHPRLRPSKGVHLVLDRARIPIRSAVLVPSVADDGSLVFMIPWGRRVYAGTTDTPYDGSLEEPTVDSSDAALILGSLDRAFAGDLSESDVLSSWAVVRPLLDRRVGPTRDLSRRHVVLQGPPGLITVTGGKLTTFRAMAEQVVDLVCRTLGAGGGCRTRELPLGLTRPLRAEVQRAAEAAGLLGWSPTAARRLVERYGDDWADALAMVRDDPRLGDEVVSGLPVSRLEVALARTREMALSDEDALVRRTRLRMMDATAPSALREPSPRG